MQTNTALMNSALVKLMQAVAGREGIRVEFDQNCTTPYASAEKVVTMPPPSAVESQMYWVYAYHELGHLMPEMRWTYRDLQRMINMEDALVCGVANIIVDNFNERNMMHRGYEGINGIMDWGRAWVLEDWFSKPADVTKAQKDPIMSLIFGLILVDADVRQDFHGHLVEAFDIEGKSKGFEAMVDALRSINVPERLRAIGVSRDSGHKKADATKELVLDILKLIGYEPKPPPEQGQGQGEAGEGQGEPCEACEGSGEGEDGDACEACGGTGEQQSEGDGGEGKANEQGNQQDLRESDPMYNPSGIGTGKGGQGVEQVDDVDKAGVDAIMKALGKSLTEVLKAEPKREHRVRNYQQGAAGYVPYAKTDEKNLEKDGTSGNIRQEYHRMIRNALGNSTVSKQISKYLKAMSTESYTYGQKSGRIHQKNIHKLVNGKPVPGVQPGIFKRKNSSVLKTDTAITILMDTSGSMSGSKFAIASACCVALNETLTGLRVAHEILGFTESYVPTHYVFKGYGTTMTKEKMLNVMASRQVQMGCNADGESVMWAAERLAQRKEKRKLLIVLSDGMPAGGYDGDGNAYLKHVANMIETESNMDLVAVGIRSTAPQKFYRNYKILHDAEKLDEVLFTLLKEYLV